LTELERDGSLRCVSCGGRFPLDPARLSRMAATLRSVDELLGSWQAPPEK
jgi:hypothetical protein